MARWLLFAALCLASLLSRGALAQDPRATAAQAAARAWLALADKGDAEASWKAAGKRFQSTMDEKGWHDALTAARGPLGETLSRAVLSTRFETKFPDGSEGEYALILFDTSFANGGRARESITLEREPDGAWRVIGYFIR